MKDYYYFLGVKRDDSPEEIRKAYRKLSLKYHPDRNDNDPYFADRFREIKEAYEILRDPEARAIYDKKLGRTQKATRSELPPVIKSFHANKIRIRPGEPVILSWKTHNADVVKIKPYGLVDSHGERRVTIEDFDATGKFQIILHATNTLLNRTVAQGITITELAPGEIIRAQEQAIHPEEPAEEIGSATGPLMIVLAAAVVLILMLYVLFFR